MTTDIAYRLRLEVGRLRARQTHGHFDTVVHLGRLGHPHVTCDVSRSDLPVLDPGTRADVVTRLLEAHEAAEATCVWLTRAGEPTVQDDDLAWLAAASRAFRLARRAARRILDGDPDRLARRSERRLAHLEAAAAAPR